MESGFQPGNVAEGEVGLARFQQVRGAGGDVRDVQPQLRTHAADVGQYARQQRDVARVGHADAKATVRGRGVEYGLVAGEAPQQRERLARRADQRVGARRGLHAGGRSHEQRVVPLAAQLRRARCWRSAGSGRAARPRASCSACGRSRRTARASARRAAPIRVRVPYSRMQCVISPSLHGQNALTTLSPMTASRRDTEDLDEAIPR